MHTKKTVTREDIPSSISPYNAQHVGRRDEQQDYFAYSDIYNKEECARIGVLSVIADGMGGMENGRLASRRATEVFFSAYIDGMNKGAKVNDALMYAVHKANDAVCAIDGAGTTLCAAVIKDGYLY